MLVEEVHAIFAAQRALGNEKAAEELENAYVEIMTSQRSFDMGPGLQPDGKPSPYAMEGFGDRVGKCTFEKTNTGHRRQPIQRNCLLPCRK